MLEVPLYTCFWGAVRPHQITPNWSGVLTPAVLTTPHPMVHLVKPGSERHSSLPEDTQQVGNICLLTRAGMGRVRSGKLG